MLQSPTRLLWPEMTESVLAGSTASTNAPPVLASLLEQHGELMAGPDLIALFKFRSERSFRRSAIAGRFPVPVVQILGRRGWFARTRDVAAWLDSLGDPLT